VLGEVRQATIARRVMSSAGWGRSEPPEPADEAGGEKPQLNARNLALQGGAAHPQ
jgi:hypothetical protein